MFAVLASENPSVHAVLMDVMGDVAFLGQIIRKGICI